MYVGEAIAQAVLLGRSPAERAMVAALLAAGAQPQDVDRALNVMRCAASEPMSAEQERRLARAVATALMEMRGLDGFEATVGRRAQAAERAWTLALAEPGPN